MFPNRKQKIFEKFFKKLTLKPDGTHKDSIVHNRTTVFAKGSIDTPIAKFVFQNETHIRIDEMIKRVAYYIGYTFTSEELEILEDIKGVPVSTSQNIISYTPVKLFDLKPTFSNGLIDKPHQIENITFKEHKRYSALQLDYFESIESFSKTIGVKNIRKAVFNFFEELFLQNQFGAFEFLIYYPTDYNNPYELEGLSKLPTSIRNAHKKQHFSLKPKELNFKIFGVKKDSSENRKVYGIISQYLFLRDGTKAINEKKNLPKKYLKPKSIDGKVKTPLFSIYHGKPGENIYIVEGLKDAVTLVNLLYIAEVENYEVVVILGIGEFKNTIKALHNRYYKNKKPNYYIVTDNDEAGRRPQEDIRRLAPSLQKRIFFIDWEKSLISPQPGGDLTDYYNSDNLKNDVFTNPAYFKNLTLIYSKEELERINYNSNKIKIEGEKNLSYTVEKNEKIKKLLLNRQDLIIQSNTGTGKSHFFKNNYPTLISKTEDKNLVLALSPLIKLKNYLIQDSDKYRNLYLDEFLETGDLYSYNDNQFYSLTIQKFGDIDIDTLRDFLQLYQDNGYKITILIDEAHNINSITKHGIDNLTELKKSINFKTILISATAYNLELLYPKYNFLDINIKKLEFGNLNIITTPKKGIMVNIKDKIIKKAIAGNRVALLSNSNIKNIELKRELEKEGLRVIILDKTSSKKIDFDNFNFRRYDVLIVTSVVEFGLNFYDSEVKEIMGVGIDDIAFSQFVSRFRDVGREANLTYFYIDQAERVNNKIVGKIVDNGKFINLSGEKIEISTKSIKEYLSSYNLVYKNINIQNDKVTIYFYSRINSNRYGIDKRLLYTDEKDYILKRAENIKDKINELTTPRIFGERISEYISVSNITYSFTEKPPKEKLKEYKNNIERVRNEATEIAQDIYNSMIKEKKGEQLQYHIIEKLEETKEGDFSNVVFDSISFSQSHKNRYLDNNISIQNFCNEKAGNYKAISLAIAINYLEREQPEEIGKLKQVFFLKGSSKALKLLKERKEENVSLSDKVGLVFTLIKQDRLTPLKDIDKELLLDFGLFTYATKKIRKNLSNIIKFRKIFNDEEKIELIKNNDEKMLKKLGLKTFDTNFLSEKHILNTLLHSDFFEYFSLDFQKKIYRSLEEEEETEKKREEEPRDEIPF